MALQTESGDEQSHQDLSTENKFFLTIVVRICFEQIIGLTNRQSDWQINTTTRRTKPLAWLNTAFCESNWLNSMEHSSLPKVKSKPRHQKHYHWAFHSTLLQISHFGRFSTEVPRTLSRLALHRQMKLPPVSRFHYHTHAPGCTPWPAAASPAPYNGPIHHSREWVLWTHPLVSRMGVQWQACLATASNPELWHSVSVLLLNVVLYASCCQQVHIWGRFKAMHHHSQATDDNGNIYETQKTAQY